MLEDAFRNVLVVAVYCSPHFFGNNTAEDKLSAVFRGRRIIKNIQLTPVKKKKKGCMHFVLVLNHIVRTAEYKTSVL